MNLKKPADPRSSMWHLTGFYLRFLRTSQGITGADLAKIMGCAPSTVSRIEAGEQHLTEKHAASIDKRWKTGGLFALLLYYARRASDPDWFRSLTEHEQRATELRIFGPLHVPGLVQTEPYARSLMESGRNPDLENALARRMARQDLVTRVRPPDIWITMAEGVLDWPVGGAGVMREQLARLIELSKLPHIVLRVVPRTGGAYEGLDGPFQVLNTPDGNVAFVEAAVEGRLVIDANDVNDFRNRFERIGAKALPQDLSRQLIEKAMDQLDEHSQLA